MAVAFAVAIVSASAATLDIAGPYGNEAGCRFAANGDYGDDSLLLLTSEEVSTFVTGCIFTTIRPQGEGAFLIDGACSHEGEEYKTTGTYCGFSRRSRARTPTPSSTRTAASSGGAVGPCD